MPDNYWNIEKVINYIKKHENKDVYYQILVKNKETQKCGYAVLTLDKRIKVFEGNDDGSDDAVYSKEEFKNKYEIKQLSQETKNGEIIIKNSESKQKER